MLEINKGMAGFGLARSDGQLIIISKVPKGKKLPNLTSNKQSKESFLKTLRSNTMQIGQTYFMKQLNKWVIPIRTRIVDDKGNIPLVMTAGLNIDGGETSWNTFGFSKEIMVQVVREDGYTQFQNTTLQSNFQSIYQTKLNQSFLNQIFGLKLANKNSVTIDSFYDNNNKKMLSVVSYLKEYGLYTIVSTPYSILNAHFKEEVIKNSTIMIVIIIVLFLLFKIINSIQLITQKNFKYIATHDPLTRLPNRLFLSNEIEKRITQKISFFLIYLDLDNFNHINDSYGHTFGDNLIKQVGQKLKILLENGSFIARQSGDEFIVLYESDSTNEVTLLLQKIFDIFSSPFVINDIEIFTGTSMGVAKYPQDGENAELLLSQSDTALYKAKQSKGTFIFFDKSMRKNSKKSLLIESELRQAIQSDEIFITYQPKIDAVTKEMVGVEALVKWHNRNLGVVPPSDLYLLLKKVVLSVKLVFL